MLPLVPDVSNLIAIGGVVLSIVLLVTLSAAMITRQFKWFGYDGFDKDD